MKKILSLLLVLFMLLPAFALAETAPVIKIGQSLGTPNDARAFAVITVVLQDDVIIAAYIDEFQFQNAADYVGVPGSDADLGKNFVEGKVLMTAYAGSTVSIADNYDAIQAFVVGKTVADLEALPTSGENVVDAISGATLVAAPGYLQGIIDAAKAAK